MANDQVGTLTNPWKHATSVITERGRDSRSYNKKKWKGKVMGGKLVVNKNDEKGSLIYISHGGGPLPLMGDPRHSHLTNLSVVHWPLL